MKLVLIILCTINSLAVLCSARTFFDFGSSSQDVQEDEKQKTGLIEGINGLRELMDTLLHSQTTLKDNVDKMSKDLAILKAKVSISKAPDNLAAEYPNDVQIRRFLHDGGLASATRPVKVADFEQYLETRLSEDGFKEEYESVPEGQYYKWDVGKSPENFPSKHRYDFSKAYDHSRVVLKVDATDFNNSDYINSNYMHSLIAPNRFVATQAPIPSTVNDHWRMIWDTGARQIVTLTKLVDDNGKVKSERYWPEPMVDIFNYKNYGDIKVTVREKLHMPEFDVRTLNVERNGQSREILHYHYLAWPDNGVPESSDSLLQIIGLIRQNSLDKNMASPIVVHCSAGVGRTGTFMLMFAMIEMADTVSEVDYLKQFASLRVQRVNMIETLPQYVFAHTALLDHLRKLKAK